MIPDKRKGSPGRRRHKASMLMDNDDLEWLSSVPSSQEDNVAYLLAEAEEIQTLLDLAGEEGDTFMIRYLHKKLRLWAAVGGERAKLVQEALIVQQPIGMVAPAEKGGD